MDFLKTAVLYGIVTFVGLYVYQQIMQRFHRLAPGPFRIPLVGNLLQIWLADDKFHYKALYKLSKKYGSIMTSNIGMVSAVTINGYDAIKSVYSNDAFLNRPDSEWWLHRSFGKRIGLGSGSIENWNPARNFTMKCMKDFGFGKRNRLQKQLEEEMTELSQTIDEIIGQSGGVLEPCTVFQIPTINTIWASVANLRFSHKDPSGLKLLDLISEYVENMKIFEGAPAAYPFLLSWFPQFFPTKTLYSVDDQMHAFLREMVTKYKEQLDDDQEPTCFLEAFLHKMKKEQKEENLEDGQIYNEETLLVILYDLFTGGGHAVNETMRFALFWLALYPECQEKLRAEIEKAAGNEEFVQYEDKARLPYTQAFILEVLRRSVIAPLFPRMVFSPTPLGDFVIPKNTAVLLNFYSVVMDDDFWGDPQNFRPSRFLDDQNNIINSERVLIFGAGKRDCIGKNITHHGMFAFITYLVRKYEFLPLKPGHPYDVNDLKNGTIIRLAKFGIRVKKLEE